MTEQQLIQHANQLLVRPRQATVGLWARAAALLARQALESSLDKFWDRCGWQLQRCSFRAQLLCLHELAGQEVARDAAYSYNFLSNVCHFNPYEASPTSVELRTILEMVESIACTLEEKADELLAARSKSDDFAGSPSSSG